MEDSIPKLLRRGLAATKPELVEQLKQTGAPSLVSAWVCLELGAERDEAGAAEAVYRAVEYLTQYAKQSGPPRRVELTELLPTFTPRNLEYFGPAVERGLDRYCPSPEDDRDQLADLTMGHFPNEQTPPGHIRLLVHHQDRVVYDAILDPIAAPDILVRVMRGDPALVGDVPVYTRSEMERRRAAGLC